MFSIAIHVLPNPDLATINIFLVFISSCFFYIIYSVYKKMDKVLLGIGVGTGLVESTTLGLGLGIGGGIIGSLIN